MVKRLSSTDQNSSPLVNVPTPISAGDAVNKTYADTKVPATRTINGKALSGNVTLVPSDIGLPKITVGATAPGSPATGDLWCDTN